jgi:hypothetical protein
MGDAMFTSVGNFAKFFFLFALLIIALVVLVPYSFHVLRRAFGTPVVQIGSFTTSEEESAKNLGPYVLAKLKELHKPVQLEGLYETQIPSIGDHFGAKDELKFLQDVHITMQGVDLPSAVSVVLGWLPEDRYVASARPEPGTSGRVLHLELRPPGDTPREWLIRPEQRLAEDDATRKDDKPQTDAARSDAASGDSEAGEKKLPSIQLVDRAIYQLVHHMYYDPNAPDIWRKLIPKEQKPRVAFPSPPALQAYFSGRQHLASYLRSFDYNELVEARREFRLLRQEMPHFVQGLMFLALTLSELRNEEEAIAAYRLAQSELSQHAQESPMSDADKKTFFQARLFMAAAYRKLYHWQQLHVAITELEQLDKDVREELKGPASIAKPSAPAAALPPLPDQDRYDFQKIRLAVLTEKAASLAYYLILLYYGNFAEALLHPLLHPSVPEDPPVPEALKSDLAEEQELKNIKDENYKWPTDQSARDRRDEVLNKWLDKIQDGHKAAVAEANKLRDEISKTAPKKEVWVSEREKMDSQLNNAEAYALFRYAQARARDDDEFRKHCRTARDLLLRADAVQPNHYLILQNLGMIYADPRFDPLGNSIATARRLFERSIKIKPDDFYGRQQLAALAVRQAYLWGPEFVDRNLIDKALEFGKQARELRPESDVIPVLLAQLYALRAAHSTDESQKKADEALAVASLAAARQAGARPVRVAIADLQFHFLRLRATDSDKPTDQSAVGSAEQDSKTKKPDAFMAEKNAFEEALKKAKEEALKVRGWESRKLMSIADELLLNLPNLKAKDRYTLRWPN